MSSIGSLPSFALSKLKSATDNFSNGNKLGEGGFGIVYKVSELSLAILFSYFCYRKMRAKLRDFAGRVDGWKKNCCENVVEILIAGA